MRDYAKDLAETPPEGMIEWAKARKIIKTEFLIYKAGWYTEPITELKSKCVDAHCTACGSDMKLDYVHGAPCHGYGPPFGFRIWEDGKPKECTSGDHTKCPECGEKVTALHVGSLRYGHKENGWVMTMGRIPEEGKKDRLAVYCWEILRETRKDGGQEWRAYPYEAYIVEETVIRRCKHWGNVGMSGRHYFAQEWTQTKGFTDTFGDIEHIYCPEGIETVTAGTTAENARLAEYMALKTKKYPVNWLRLWLKHRNIDTVFSVGAGEIVAGMIERFREQPRYNSYTGYNKANNDTAWLQDLDWKQKRPAQIMRMNAGELRDFIRAGGGAEETEKLIALRKSGISVEIPDSLPLLRGTKTEELKRLGEFGEETGKAARYLAAQNRRYKSDRRADAALLVDYFELCGKAGWDITDKAVRHPANLRRAHDQALSHIQFEEKKALKEKFRRQAERLEKYAFGADGFEIRIPQRENDLIVEGKALKHCVASYAKRHAEGTVTILFIRRSEEPDIPFYTLSIYEDSMTVCMNNGYRNCGQTPEVKAFEDKFMAWARAGCKRDKKTGEPILEEKKTA